MKEYKVTLGGLEDQTVLLDEDDAKRRGATEVKAKAAAPAKAATAQNKARGADNK